MSPSILKSVYFWLFGISGSIFAGLIFSVFNDEIRTKLILIWNGSDVWHILLLLFNFVLVLFLLYLFWRLIHLNESLRQLQKRNIRLVQKLDTDQKSGLSSYEYLKNQFREEYLPLVKAGSDFSVLMIDLVNFKKINDEYGHDVGDAVISFVGGFLKVFVRGRRDMVARFGEAADEFFIVVEGDDKALAGFTSRLRRDFKEEQLGSDTGLDIFSEKSVSISFWSAGSVVLEDDTWETLRKRLVEGLMSVKRVNSKASVMVQGHSPRP